MANNFILGESGIMRTGKTVPKVIRNANADILDTLFANKKNIAEEVGNVKKTVSKAKPIGKYMPFVGDTIDIGNAIHSYKTGHPWVGTGQLGLGIGGLILDTASLLAAPATGGASLGGIAAKQAGKQTVKSLAKNLIKYGAKAQTKKAIGPTSRTIYSAGLNLFKEGGNNQQQPIQKEASAKNNQQTKQPSVNNQYKQKYPYTAPFDSIENLILSRTGGYNNNIEGQDLPNIQSLNTSNTTPNAEDSIVGNVELDGMIDRYKRQQELQKPYIEGLQNLIDNYNNLQRNAMNLDRYFTGLAGWSGNDRWADFGRRYNPITTEATKLDLLNKLAQGQIGIDDIENEMRGNIALAQQAGIDPRVAMANPKLVDALASIENAKTSAEARKYVADQNRETKLAGIYSNAMIQKAKQEGNWDLALKLQAMRNDGRLQSAIVNAVSFGADPSIIYSALQGYNNGGNVQNYNQQPPKEIITTPAGSIEASTASKLLDNTKR